MKVFHSLLLLVLLCSGCVLRTGTSASHDGLGNKYEVRDLAERTAQELRQRYSPAQTVLALERAPGAFGDHLEQALRNNGFAVGTSGTVLSYTVDVFEDGAPPMGYVQIRLPEGQFFSFSRELEAPLWPTVNPEPVTPAPAVAENELPFANDSPMVPLQPVVSASASQVKESKPEPASIPTVSPRSLAEPLPPHTVNRTATAAQVAKRNKVPVIDFCRWNDVTATETLPVGYRVHLQKPVVIASKSPVSTAQPVPASTSPVSAPAPSAPVPAPLVAMPTLPAEPDTLNPMSSAKPISAPLPVIEKEAREPISASSALPLPESLPSDPLQDPIPPLEVWSISPGGLRGQMKDWASKAGYQLVWKAENDFDMESNASFLGEFLNAVQSLFSGMQRTGHALRVTIYQGNRVVEVTEG